MTSAGSAGSERSVKSEGNSTADSGSRIRHGIKEQQFLLCLDVAAWELWSTSASHPPTLVSVDIRTRINVNKTFVFCLGCGAVVRHHDDFCVTGTFTTMNHHQRDSDEAYLDKKRSFAQMLPSSPQKHLPVSDIEIGEGARTDGFDDAMPTNSSCFPSSGKSHRCVSSCAHLDICDGGDTVFDSG